MENIGEGIISNIIPFLNSLIWGYIITFILLCYGWQEIEKSLNRKWIYAIRKRFKVAVIGLLYAIVHYFLWGLEKEQIGMLFSSFLVSFTFHKLLIELLVNNIKSFFSQKESQVKGDENG